MMKKILILCILLILIPSVFAKWNINSESTTINLKIKNDFTINRQSNARLDFITLNQSYFPKEDYKQSIIQQTILPEATVTSKYIFFKWNNPIDNKLEYVIDTDLKITNKRKEITQKIAFPLSNIPSEIKQYTLPSETIDSDNPKIIALANEIAKGKDDLYKVTNDLASWVKNNIEYDLSTLTSQASQKATWVLTNKQGVCDELSTLFIALARSIGIPAKFSSGISYTDSPLFDEEWGNHGWAEVYFPGFGWVEYDVTYSQLGFIDPTHIKLKDGIDPAESSSKYNWFGYNVDIDTKSTQFETTLIEKEGTSSPNIFAEISPLYNTINFGSSNIISTKIKNLNNFYISEELYLFGTQETLIQNEKRFITLSPLEEKILFWKIKIEPLQQKFIYTFPVGLKNQQNLTFNSSFQVSSKGTIFTSQEADMFIQPDTLNVNENFNIICTSKQFYDYENKILNCTISNQGNTPTIIETCFEECINTYLGISQQKQIILPYNTNKTGTFDIRSTGKKTTITSQIILSTLDTPNLKIANITHPKTISYKERLTVSFDIEQLSKSAGTEIKAYIKSKKYTKEIGITNLENIKIDLPTYFLEENDNNLELIFEYKDLNKKIFQKSTQFQIQLNKLNLFEKISFYFNRLFSLN